MAWCNSCATRSARIRNSWPASNRWPKRCAAGWQHSSRLLELRRTGGLEAVQHYLAQNRTRPGVALQARVRELARDMKSAEIRLLNEREHDARQSALVTQGVIVCGSALALTFVGLAIFAIRRDYAGRARAEAELSRFFDLSLELFVICGKRRLLQAQ